MKYFCTKFFVIFFIFLFFNQNLVFAETNDGEIFDVRSISVDISSTSSSIARQIAIQEAQEKAFKSLMRKMLLKGEYEKIPELDKNIILNFVEEIEIESEKTTDVRYIGSITVRFKKKSILNFLKTNDLKFSITKSKPLLILPIYQYGGVTYLWDDQNVWKNLWADRVEEDVLIPIKSSDGKFKDFIHINPTQAIKKNLKKLENLANFYNSTGVLIAILKKKYNRDKSKIILDLDLSIHRFDGGTTNEMNDRIEIYSNEFSDDLLLEAKYKVQDFVNNQWKVQNVLSSNKNIIKLTVNFKNLNDWVNIRNLLNSVSLINSYTLEKFSYNLAFVSVYFSGTIEQLKVALKQSDLEFDINNKNIALVK